MPGPASPPHRTRVGSAMKHTLKRVCVIGAGLTGLACALAAASRGLSVRVFDEASQQRVFPAHVDVVPSMLRDLVELGVGDECVRAGFAYRGVDFVDARGRVLHEVTTERLAGARFPAAIGIARAQLHQVLASAALAHGVQIADNVRADSVQALGEQARVVLSNGEMAEADLVLLAAGANSALRAALFPQAQAANEISQAWWYALVQRPIGLDRPLVALSAAGRRVMMVPVRSDTAGLALIEPMPAILPTSPAAHLRKALMSFAPCVRAVAPQFDGGLPVALRSARSGLLGQPWHSGAVLAVGDCAHALPPHFGQAAAQGIEDAKVLGELLADATVASDRTSLFAAFEGRRVERARQVHELTNTAMRWDVEPESTTDLGLLMRQLASTVAQPA
jgi:2-polyprenyl-6-methoxyphenol hydroxylase-like FAD-dependent oxidoreductase